MINRPDNELVGDKDELLKLLTEDCGSGGAAHTPDSALLRTWMLTIFLMCIHWQVRKDGRGQRKIFVFSAIISLFYVLNNVQVSQDSSHLYSELALSWLK